MRPLMMDSSTQLICSSGTMTMTENMRRPLLSRTVQKPAAMMKHSNVTYVYQLVNWLSPSNVTRNSVERDLLKMTAWGSRGGGVGWGRGKESQGGGQVTESEGARFG
eukprot:168290-Chlamydomonas_euryale.AAC.1